MSLVMKHSPGAGVLSTTAQPQQWISAQQRMQKQVT
jgi:hypothetical protein